MVPETEKIDFRPIELPKARRNVSGYVKIAAALLAVCGLTWAWQAGYRPSMLSQAGTIPLDVVEIDRGDVDIVVVEYGALESASNTVVRCQVEALIGTVGGAQGGTSKGSGASGGGSGQGSSAGGAGGSQGSSGGGRTGGGREQQQQEQDEEKGRGFIVIEIGERRHIQRRIDLENR